MVVPVVGSTLRVVIWAKMKKHSVTKICRPYMNPGRLVPSPRNNNSHVFMAMGDDPRSWVGNFDTAIKAICIPSSIPTMANRTKKRTTEPAPWLWIPVHRVVCP